MGTSLHDVNSQSIDGQATPSCISATPISEAMFSSVDTSLVCVTARITSLRVPKSSVLWFNTSV